MSWTNVIIFAFSTFILSCNEKKGKHYTPITTYIEVLDTSNFEANKVDTFGYLNISYWNSTKDRSESAYIDTFSVNGDEFRFINPGLRRSFYRYAYLEKSVNHKWISTELIIQKENHKGDFFHNRDINGDSFIDITQNIRFVQSVCFYNSQAKNYIDTIYSDNIDGDFINPDWQLIDTANKIFCDFQEFKLMCDNIHSILYTYNGYKRINLFDLTLYNCTKTNNDTHLITKLILSKCVPYKNYNPQTYASSDSLVKIETIPLSKPIDLEKDYEVDGGYFDYVSFWKSRYLKLLGLKPSTSIRRTL